MAKQNLPQDKVSVYKVAVIGFTPEKIERELERLPEKVKLYEQRIEILKKKIKVLSNEQQLREEVEAEE